MQIDQLLARVWDNMLLRVSGPLKFRLVIQPAVALFLAIRGGLKDAREDKPAYFWTLFTNPEERRALLRDGWKAVGRLFIIAVVMDVIYQWIEQRWVYPGEAVIVAILLAIIPYLLIRGPVNRISRLFHKHPEDTKEP